MALGLGFAFNQLVSPEAYYQLSIPVADRHGDAGSTDAQLALVDGFRNSWANALGITAGNGTPPTDPFTAPAPGSALGQNSHLFPASISVWVHIGNPNNLTQDPAPWSGGFPRTDLMDGFRLRGITPMLNWELNINSAKPYQWPRWSSGLFDAYLDMWGDAINAWASNANSVGVNWQGDPKSSLIIIRLGWEQNGNWFPWSPGIPTDQVPPPNTHGGAPLGAGTVAEFKAGFKYIRNYLVKTKGCSNVKFLYCPNYRAPAQDSPVSQYLDASGQRTVSSMTAQYPGDDACDFVGFDVYHEGVPASGYIGTGTVKAGVNLYQWEPSIRSGWRSGYDEFTDPQNTAGPAGSKQIIIGEFGIASTAPISGAPSSTSGQRLQGQAAFFDPIDWTWESKSPTKDLAGGLMWAKNNMPNIRLMQYFDFPPFTIDGIDIRNNIAYSIEQISDGRLITDPANHNVSFVGSLPSLSGSEVTELAVLDADVDIADGTGMSMTGDMTFAAAFTEAPDNASFYLYEGSDMDTLEPVWD